tara:strand:+ start:34 stop:480 length:447 start_codon:yes stop_codon:yes gene_type:complete
MSKIKGLFCPQCSALNRIDLSKVEETKLPTCGKCTAELSNLKTVQNISEQQLEKLLAHSTIPTIVDVYADWCGPCKMYGPIFSKVGEANWKDFNFIKMDSEKNLFFSSKYQIRGIPATLFFNGTQLVHGQSGLMQEAQLQSILSQVKR